MRKRAVFKREDDRLMLIKNQIELKKRELHKITLEITSSSINASFQIMRQLKKRMESCASEIAKLQSSFDRERDRGTVK